MATAGSGSQSQSQDSDKMEVDGANKNNATKEQVLSMMEDKKKVEAELEQLYEVLKTQKVGMDEPLVDKDGYPRNDIDVYQVRKARARINVLRNDLKDVMGKIEAGIHDLHRQSREGVGANSPEELMSRHETQQQPLPATFAK